VVAADSPEEAQVATGSFSVDDLAKIKEAIFQAEMNNNGEIVPVIIKQSDFYPAAHFRLALLGAFLGDFLYYQFSSETDPIYFLYLFIVGAVIGFLLGHIGIFKMLFTTKDEVEEETRQRAMESFLTNGVVDTPNRNGVQLFISLLEHKVIITVDSGLQGKLGTHSNEVWQKVLEELLLALKAGNHTHAIIKAIEEMGKILTQHYPAEHTSSNDLPNKLIIEL